MTPYRRRHEAYEVGVGPKLSYQGSRGFGYVGVKETRDDAEGLPKVRRPSLPEEGERLLLERDEEWGWA